jgi:hypothetical protein
MKKLLLATSFLANLAAFANSNAASKLYVCATAQNSDLDQSEFEALEWVEIGAVGSRGEMGKTTNMLTYNTWNTSVSQKAKGTTDAGSPELEVARLPGDAGQDILRTAAAVGNNNNYAFKEVRADGTTADNGTVIYNRGLVSGPRRPGGRNEDFDVEIYTLGFQQEEVLVDPTSAGVAPYVTANPAITGTAEDGETLTLGNGTWAGDATITYAYDWYANNVKLAGQNASTLLLATSHVGKRITGRVTASNNSGKGYATTAPTAAVGA